ncbi:MAG: hypothetical protein M1817_004317 [Caeruleum heppii]|nr:MAG: hypothetical protein M1817_004317 [Caeruleum heppii]
MPKLPRPSKVNVPRKRTPPIPRSESLSRLRERDSTEGDKSRVRLVRPQLCDDVLARLAPSLQRHIGCDIVEMNPGPGLWSRKLHELLRPRSHILLETEPDAYASHLQPLFDQPGSRYRKAPFSALQWTSFERLVQDGFLPHQTPLELDDPRRDRPNDSLLFVATVANSPPKRVKGFQSSARLLLRQLFTSIRKKDGFNAFGLVRMLIWMPNSDKKSLLPRTIATRLKSSVEAEIHCGDIFEIAGSAGGSGINKREPYLDYQSHLRVTQSMLDRSISTPSLRKSYDQAEAEAALASGDNKEDLRGLHQGRPWLTELAALKKRFEAGEFTQWEDKLFAKTKGRNGRSNGVRRQKHPDFVRMRNLINEEKSQEKRLGMVYEVLDLEDSMEAIDRSLIEDSTCSDEERQARERQLVAARQLFMHGHQELDLKLQVQTSFFSDDRHAFANDPSLLLWDRRRDEPLVAHKNEFEPHCEMTLMDLHPRPLLSTLRQGPESYFLLEYILTSLFGHPASPVARALDALAPGAAEAIIPQAPSLQDPRKGGRTAISQMRVRNLTPEMIDEIVRAWERWPFRPSRTQMILTVGSFIERA